MREYGVAIFKGEAEAVDVGHAGQRGVSNDLIRFRTGRRQGEAGLSGLCRDTLHPSLPYVRIAPEENQSGQEVGGGMVAAQEPRGFTEILDKIHLTLVDNEVRRGNPDAIRPEPIVEASPNKFTLNPEWQGI